MANKNVEIPLVLDGSPVLRQLSEIKETLQEISQQAGKTEKEIQDAFTKGTQKAGEFDKRLEQAAHDQQDLNKAVDKLDNSSKSFDEAGQKVDELTGKTEKARDEMGRFTKQGEKGLGGLGGLVKRVGGMIAAAFAVGVVSQFIGQIITATAQTQKFGAMLKVALGSKSAAGEAMSMLSDFAKKTPFELEELTSSYVKFANRGLRLTQQELTKIGDLAASQGKSFEQLTEAILDASTGEFERLKEFGIKATQEGGKVQLMFKNQKVEVEKNGVAIQEAIIAMGAYNGIAGGMAEQSKTLGGQISNMKDSFFQLATTIGEILAPVISGVLGGFNWLLGGLKDLLSVEQNLTQETVASTLAQRNAATAASGLLAEYEQLKNKGVKATADEKERLNAITYQLRDALGESVVAINKETGALEVNIAAAKKAIEQKLLLSNQTASTLALQLNANKTQTKGLEQELRAREKIFKELEAKYGNLVDTGGALDMRSDNFAKGTLTPQQKAQKAQLDAARSNYTALLKQVDELKKKKGDLVTGLKDLGFTEDSADLDKMAAEAQAAIDKAKAEAAAGSGFGAGPREPKKQRTASQMDLLRDQLALERELTAARLELMEEGKAKEVATEQVKNKLLMVELGARLTQAKAGSQEEKSLMELMELEKERHTKALIDIDKKYFEQQQQLAKEGQEMVEQLTLKGRELELDNLRDDAAEQADAIKKKYKDNKTLQLVLLSALGQDLAEKEQEINLKYDQKAIDEEEKRAILQAEISIKNEEAKQLAILLIKRQAAQRSLDLLTAAGKGENDLEVLNAKKLLGELDGSVKKLQDGIAAKGQEFNLQGLLVKAFGMGDDEAGEAAEAIGKAMGSIMDNIFQALHDGVDRQIAEKQRLVDALSEQISEVEAALNRERDLQEQGFANNTALRERELATLKQQKEAALKEEEAAQKKKQQLVKAQMAIDTISQVSSLITASTDIFKSVSKIPIVGVPLAIGLIAAMFGAFVGAKAQAFKLAGTQKFEEGGEIGGKRHSQGGNKYYSADHSEIMEIEQGEWITKRKQSKKYRQLLEAINSDDISSMSIDQLGRLIDPSGSRMKPGTQEEGLQLHQSSQAVLVNNQLHAPKMEKQLSSMDEKLGTLVQIQKDQEQVQDLGDKIKITKGSKTTYIKK